MLINSEEIACGVCVEALADLGMILTAKEYATRYSGRPVAEAWKRVAQSGELRWGADVTGAYERSS